jgi:hypothetical protein
MPWGLPAKGQQFKLSSRHPMNGNQRYGDMRLSGMGVNVGVAHVPVSSGLPLKVVVKLKPVSEPPAPVLVLEGFVTAVEVSAN